MAGHALNAGFWLGFLLPVEKLPRRAWLVLGPLMAAAGIAYLVFGSEVILARVGACLVSVACGVLATLDGLKLPEKSGVDIPPDANE